MKTEEGESSSYQTLPAEHRPTVTTESPSCETSSLTNAPLSEGKRQSNESTELRTAIPETSTAELKPKSPKAVKKNQQRGRGRGRGGGLREEERGQRGSARSDSTEARVPPGGRRGGAGRGRRGRVGGPQDTEYAPSR